MNRVDFRIKRSIAGKMSARLKGGHLGESFGFTLLELVLATMISALVMGILATAFSFSLRVWEKQMNRKTSDMPALLDLLKWQLADFDPVPLATGEGNETHTLFLADDHSLAFTTDRSVKALSKDAPIIARYVYSKSEKKLYYAERPLDPYHPDDLKRFLKMKPGDPKSWPQFYPTPAEQFQLAYAGADDKSSRTPGWEDQNKIPSIVLVKWSPAEGAGSSIEVMVPGFLFQVDKDAAQKARNAPPGALSPATNLNSSSTPGLSPAQNQF